jgi:hypothetical protein
MTSRPKLQRRRDPKAEALRIDDLDNRLNRIVKRSAQAIAEKTKVIIREKELSARK